jgi:LemA protein
MIIALIVLAAIVVFVIAIVGIYNNLVALRNRYKNAYSQIDIQLKRRYDLIPNLVEVAKGYLQHERGTLEAVVKARTIAQTAGSAAAANPGDPSAMKQLAGAEAALGVTMGKFFALAESYPDLKANQTMMQLSEELTATENKVAFARQAYNDTVMIYNTAREKFPNTIIANSFGFLQASLLAVISEAKEREAPKVSFT